MKERKKKVGTRIHQNLDKAKIILALSRFRYTTIQINYEI